MFGFSSQAQGIVARARDPDSYTSSMLLALGEHWEGVKVAGLDRRAYLCICVRVAFAEDLLQCCLVLPELVNPLGYCSVQ